MSRIQLNLNYFFALALVGSVLAIGWVAPPIRRLILSSGGDIKAYSMVSYVAPVFVIVLVALIWRIKGALSPIPASPGAALWFRIGNVAMAIANSAIVLSLLVSVIGFIVHRPFGLAVGFIIAGALMLAFPLDIIGIFCVEISRLLNRIKPSQPQQ